MEIIKLNESESQLPVRLEDLAQFVLIGRDKLTAVRAGIKALDKLDVAEGVRKQKREEAQMLAEALLDAEVRIGEILAAMPKATGKHENRGNQYKSGKSSSAATFSTKDEAIKGLGFDKFQVSRFQTLAANKDLVETIKQEAREADDLPTRTAVLQAVKYQQKIDSLTKAKKDREQSLKLGMQMRPLVKHSDAIDFLHSLEDNSIDLFITDPPYSTDIKNIDEFASKWISAALPKIKYNGRAFICIGAYPAEINAYLNILLRQNKFIIDSPLIWTYKNTLGVTPKMKYNLNYQVILHLYSDKSPNLDNSITNEMFSVMEINAPDGRMGNRYHTWQKPDELAMRLINHASKPGDLVIDTFACTGTFLLMAAKLGRVAKGCDISIENLQIAKQRGCEIIGNVI